MIYVVGSVNLDYVARMRDLPRPGETVLGVDLQKNPGGKGANQALAARRAGADVRLIGCIGDDEDGVAATALLAEAGVDLTGLAKTDATTGIAMIQIDAAGENSIAVLPGANALVTAAAVEGALAGLRSEDFVVIQQEIPQDATRAAISAARAAGATSVLNIAPVLPGSAELAREADIVVANETEFACLSTAEPSLAAAFDWCDETGRKLALTLGSEGAIFAGESTPLHARPPKINPLDTVGAGDTFVGYLAACLHARMSAEKALEHAVRASAQACLTSGAQIAIPRMDELRI